MKTTFFTVFNCFVRSTPFVGSHKVHSGGVCFSFLLQVRISFFLFVLLFAIAVKRSFIFPPFSANSNGCFDLQVSFAFGLFSISFIDTFELQGESVLFLVFYYCKNLVFVNTCRRPTVCGALFDAPFQNAIL